MKYCIIAMVTVFIRYNHVSHFAHCLDEIEVGPSSQSHLSKPFKGFTFFLRKANGVITGL